MSSRIARWTGVAFAVAASAAVMSACGGSGGAAKSGETAPGEVAKASTNDDSRCDFRGRRDREAIEGNGPGAKVANIRKVYAIVGQGEDARRMLVCREVDTNLDGKKDVVRFYNEKGEANREQADSNYDGKLDTTITFAKGRIAKVEFDSDGDGSPDQIKFYLDGKLNRMQRDTNRDGKPDVWEIYTDGSLERMGVDTDYDGHVDRWDRDMIVQRQLEEKERAEEQAAAKKEEDKKSDELDGGAVTDARVSARKR